MKNFKKAALIGLSVLMAVNAGCSAKLKSKYNIKAKALTESVDKISTANNKTAFKMLGATFDSRKGENSIISPLSLSTVFSLTQNGAAGKTREEMLKALEMTGLNDKDINEQYQAVIANYNSVEALKLKMANSIWIDKGTAVNESFINTGRDYYEAETSNVDFSKAKAADSINSWISDHTAGKIKKIADKFDDDTALVLVNTVYFKGDWLQEFERKNTRKDTFTNYDGSHNDVSMMNGDLYTDYLKESNFAAIRMSYKDDNFGMYVFLPDEGNSIKDFIKDMNSESWNKWKKGFVKNSIMVEMPKLHIEFEQELNSMLKGFGMKSAFEPGADFSKMSPDNNLYISLVKQKCYIDVDEKGTEAAAATIVGMTKSAMGGAEKSFIANRPFVYVIEDKNTGLILFMGAVEKL